MTLDDQANVCDQWANIKSVKTKANENGHLRCTTRKDNLFVHSYLRRCSSGVLMSCKYNMRLVGRPERSNANTSKPWRVYAATHWGIISIRKLGCLEDHGL